MEWTNKIKEEYKRAFSRSIEEVMYYNEVDDVDDDIYEYCDNYIRLDSIWFKDKGIFGRESEEIGSLEIQDILREEYSVKYVLDMYNSIVSKSKSKYKAPEVIPYLEFSEESFEDYESYWEDIPKLLYELYGVENHLKYYDKIGVKIKLDKELKIKLDGKVYYRREYFFVNSSRSDKIYDKENGITILGGECEFDKCEQHMPDYFESDVVEIRDRKYVYVQGYYLADELVEDKTTLYRLRYKYNLLNEYDKGLCNK